MYKRLQSRQTLMRYVILTAMLSVSLHAILSAQDIQFVARAEPDVLRVGEQFTIIYEANHNLSDIELPEFNDFQYMGGPSVGQSTQIESSPGKTYTKTTYSYTYYFRAVKEGKYTVAPAKATFKNKNYQSNSITVEIVGSGSSASSAKKDQDAANASAASSDDVYVRLLVNKKEAYIGEQIVATIKLYTKLQISGLDERYKGPDFTGFYTEPIEIPPLRNLERENVNGDIYYSGVLQKVLLIPQKTGQLIIEPFDLDIAVRQQVKRKSNSFFDEFFEPSVRDIPVKLTSNRVTIKCKPLPVPKPASFTGAVGSFTLSSSVDKPQVMTNDAVNYKITLKGTGNYKIVDEPVINFPPDVEKYDPVIKTSDESPMTGTKTFEYLLIPHYPGEFTIPPVEFTYFDIQSKQFKTIQTASHTIYVEKGEGDTLLPVIAGMAKEDIKLLSSDIQYIKLKSKNLDNNGKFLVGDIRFYLFYLLLAILSGLVLWLYRNHIRRTSDLLLIKNRKASKYARRRLKKASRMIKTGNKTEFYDELHKAIWLYLSDKLGIPIADLSKESARCSLASCRVNEETMNKLFTIIHECELARYAPASNVENTGKLLDETIKLIVRLQQEIS
ncbi:MAG: protein BatD [Bacteroidales bacterium]|nr:protein BatD [Bacteroidales bacterium]